MTGTIDRRRFLRGLVGGLVGLTVAPSGLVVPDDAMEPVKRFWPGWRAGQAADESPLLTHWPSAPIHLMAGDVLQLTYTIRWSTHTEVNVVSLKEPAQIRILAYDDQNGYSLLVNDQPGYTVRPGRVFNARPGLFSDIQQEAR